MRRIIILDHKGAKNRYSVLVYNEWNNVPFIAYAGNSHKSARLIANSIQESINHVSGMEIAIGGEIQ